MANETDAKFIRIRVKTILPDHPIPFDLFVLINGKYVHYLRAGEKLSADKINQLGRAEVFYVLESQRPGYKSYIHEQLTLGDLSSETKALILRETSLTLAEEIFEKEDVQEALNDSKVLVGNLVEFMNQEPAGMANLLSLSQHDFYTYNHSLDVGIYSLGLGHIMKLENSELVELGRGALFHDIGKRMVPVEIITKKGGLNDAEWVQMQKHPQFGLKLMQQYEVTEAMKAACFEHHENFLGNGYPQQLPGNEIHPHARIVAITDTFDALTTKRSYNVPMSPRDALTMMLDKLGNRYDPDFLNAFSSAVGDS